MNKTLEYLTKENITFLLSIIGFLGTLCNAIYFLITHREKLDVQIFGKHMNDKALILYVSFVNQSTLPLNIIDVRLIVGNQKFFSHKIPRVIGKNIFKKNGEILRYTEYYNEPYPINIPSYGGNSCYIYFAFPQGHDLTFSTTVSFEFVTSHHKIIRKTLQLDIVAPLLET